MGPSSPERVLGRWATWPRAGCRPRPAQWASDRRRRRGPAVAWASRAGPVALRHRVEARHRSEVRVGEAVAVDVLEHARSCPSASLSPTFLITPSFTATTGAPRRVKMPMPAVLAALDQWAAFSPWPTFFSSCARQVVGVAGAGVDGEASLGQAGERAHEVGGHAGDQAGAQEHGVHVPVGVVVGEHRAAHVASRSRRRPGSGRRRRSRRPGCRGPCARRGWRRCRTSARSRA